LGFLAAVTGLAVATWFSAAMGVPMSLQPGGTERAAPTRSPGTSAG
jgi:hypothetical protein